VRVKIFLKGEWVSQISFLGSFDYTRSYAALRAADLNWIVGPGYSWGGAGISKNVTHAGSQLPREGGGAGISKNVTHAGSQLTF